MADTALAGQVALVTGASRGIGRAAALRLAASGASVAVAYGSQPDAANAVVEQVRSFGVAAVALRADLEDGAAAAGLVDQTAAALGGLNIVVNNAGISRDGLCVRLSDEDWSQVIAVDLTAAFHICRAAMRPMLRRRSGRIINVSSISGVSGNPGQSNYSAAKAGLIGLTKALSREVATRDITVNAVAPGFIETDMTAALSDELRAGVARAVPAGRLGTPDEVAHAIHFLALPQSGYITGAVLHVDGGLGA